MAEFDTTSKGEKNSVLMYDSQYILLIIPCLGILNPQWTRWLHIGIVVLSNAIFMMWYWITSIIAKVPNFVVVKSSGHGLPLQSFTEITSFCPAEFHKFGYVRYSIEYLGARTRSATKLDYLTLHVDEGEHYEPPGLINFPKNFFPDLIHDDFELSSSNS